MIAGSTLGDVLPVAILGIYERIAIMPYLVTYWTGKTETVKADSVRGVYAALGYRDGDGSVLWDDDEPNTGIVTNEHGDVCVRIRRA